MHPLDSERSYKHECINLGGRGRGPGELAVDDVQECHDCHLSDVSSLLPRPLRAPPQALQRCEKGGCVSLGEVVYRIGIVGGACLISFMWLR